MAEYKSNVALKEEEQAPARTAPREWEPFESLRRQVDRMFEDFGRGLGLWRPSSRSMLDVRPSWPFEEGWGKAPAVDVCEREREYEITAELPGMDASNIDVKLANGVLTIKGEKKEEKEEKEKGKRLLSVGAAVRLVPAFVPTARGNRRGQDSGEFRKGRVDDHAAERRRGAEAGKEDIHRREIGR